MSAVSLSFICSTSYFDAAPRALARQVPLVPAMVLIGDDRSHRRAGTHLIGSPLRAPPDPQAGARRAQAASAVRFPGPAQGAVLPGNSGGLEPDQLNGWCRTPEPRWRIFR